jgi:hypothetical protein
MNPNITWIIVQLRKIEQNTNPDLWLHAPDYVAKFEMKVKTCANEPKYYVDHCPIEPTKPTEPCEHCEPNEPTDPTDLTEPTEPTEPTKPTEHTEPTKPDPTDPTEPIAPI